jgi:hypothetical protein
MSPENNLVGARDLANFLGNLSGFAMLAENENP